MKSLNVKFLLWFSLLSLQTAAQQPGEADTLRERFQRARWETLREKVYLHTDRERYTAGEYVWFRAYRTDAASHVPTVFSRFVYVELCNQRGIVVERLKLREEDGVFHGSLKLDPYLAAGKYCLRAYTYWMQNFDEDFYFKREIDIESAALPDLRREVRWEDGKDGDRLFCLRLTTERGETFPKGQLDCRMYKGKKQVRMDIEVVDKEGWVRYRVPAADSVTSLRVQFRKKRPFEFQATFKVPAAENLDEVDVQFLPEGGHLLAGVRTQVNFKAVGTDGYGRNVSGEIVRDDGEVVAFFVSSHLGMGRFDFLPEEGRQYHALVHTSDTAEKSIALPEVLEEGIALHAEVRDSALHYECRGTEGFIPNRPLYLLVHCRGDLLSLQPVEPGWSGELLLEGLPAGIIHAALLDGEGEVYGNRLSFVYPQKEVTVKAETHWAYYGKRDEVQLSLQLEGADSLSCSVAVVDSAQAGSTRWGSHIVNYFLLCSDLKGHVEEPGWYFDNSIPRQHRARMLDLLLSTQGWQRFDVGRICRGEQDTLLFFLEMAQGISGKVEKLFGRQADNPKVFAVAPAIGLLRQVEVEGDGSFHLNVDFPDSTTFVFQALTKRNTKNIYLEVWEDSLRKPEKELFLAERLALPAEQKTVDSLAAPPVSGDGISAKNYYYVGSQKVYLLEEAKVVDRKKISTDLERYQYIADQILEERDIKEEGYETLEEWILSIPSVFWGPTVVEDVIEGSIQTMYYVCRSPKPHDSPVKIYVDDLNLKRLFPVELIPDIIRDIPIQYIQRMGYVRLGMSSVPTLYIYFKPGYNLYSNVKRLSLKSIDPLGYHEPAEFYQPKYEVAEERENPEPDERATLYWNPDVRLDAGRGDTLRFYTSDREAVFQVILEGIAPTGELVWKVMDLPLSPGSKKQD